MEGRMGIVSGRYRPYPAMQNPPNRRPSWNSLGDAKTGGRSVYSSTVFARRLRLLPSVRGTLSRAFSFVEDRLAHVRAMENVVKVTGPVVKWTQLGDRPVWNIEVDQPFHVPALRSCSKPVPYKFSQGTSPS